MYAVRPPGPIGYGRRIPVDDLKWKLRWPFVISTIIAVVIIVFSLIIFALEIASLAKFTTSIEFLGITYGRTASTGAGIWCGFFILIAGVLILLIKFLSRTRRWATAALIATIIAACASIILIGLDAKAVQDGRALSDISRVLPGSHNFHSKFRILAAQLAFACLVFLLCIVFIALYIIVLITLPKSRHPQQLGLRPQLRY